MDTVIVIMQKNMESGFLEKELASLKIDKNEELIVSLFALLEDTMKLHIRLSTDRDVEDWEYGAVFDYYDTEIFNGKAQSVIENTEGYNPEWEIVIEYSDDILTLETEIVEILKIHRTELDEVYEIIKDKKGEYSDEE